MKSLVFISFIFIQSLLFAEGNPLVNTAVVKGQVFESGSEETLSGVRVCILGTDIFTYTDKDGNFTIENVPAGEIKLSFNLVSFETSTMPLGTLPGQESECQVALESR